MRRIIRSLDGPIKVGMVGRGFPFGGTSIVMYIALCISVGLFKARPFLILPKLEFTRVPDQSISP